MVLIGVEKNGRTGNKSRRLIHGELEKKPIP